MTTADALRATIAERLGNAGVPTPAVDARWLVEAATGEGGVDIDRLEQMVARRVAREPLQVVVGTTVFRNVTLRAVSGVFVPRPETEVVAGVAIDAALAVSGHRPVVVDAATGSGAIALAVASEVPGVRVVATELDPTARRLAEANLADLRERMPEPSDPWRSGDHLAPGADVEIVRADVLDGVDVSLEGIVDVLVSNPPYLPASDRGTWEPEVADHDPDVALVAGADGHEVVDHLLGRAVTWLRPGGTVVVEIDDRRGDDAVRVARAAGLVDVELVVDLTGRDRAVRGRRAGAS